VGRNDRPSVYFSEQFETHGVVHGGNARLHRHAARRGFVAQGPHGGGFGADKGDARRIASIDKTSITRIFKSSITSTFRSFKKIIEALFRRALGELAIIARKNLCKWHFCTTSIVISIDIIFKNSIAITFARGGEKASISKRRWLAQHNY
jgi:hypothetical protein